jgi:hypothetical protein
MATYWTAHLEPRQQTHVAFARAYARDFNHGAPGHLDLVLVARLAELLDAANQTLQEIAGGAESAKSADPLSA